MKTVLITGANKSIGFETTKQLLKQGFYVYLGCRDIGKGEEAVSQLKAAGLENVEPILIDVNDPASVKTAQEYLTGKISVLDVLINNAGIAGGFPQNVLDTEVAVYREVFDTNVFGVIEVTRAFLDLLRKADQPRIVNVTSGLGSLNLHADPSWKYYAIKPVAYLASKAALNGYTIALAYELRDTAFRINAVDPGYTATDFNHHSGPGTVEEAAARVVKAATLDDEGPTGQFYSDDNSPETGLSPW
jgi:NAD(P)-dependent dehydrogenase (short-subunit alcohol dehydrogenase family)